jgi:hypothetical protein
MIRGEGDGVAEGVGAVEGETVGVGVGVGVALSAGAGTAAGWLPLPQAVSSRAGTARATTRGILTTPA